MFSHYNLCFCNSQPETVVLPLKTQTIPHGSPTNKLSFHHNVTLTISLTVGSPPQNVTMVLDTGSELSWLHCKKSPNFNSVFNPLASKTYSPVSCSSPTCRTRTRDLSIPVSCDPKKLCHATLSYADASSLEGNLASETFNLKSSGQPGTIFGCMDSGFSSNSEEDAKTTGLMGMNRGALSFVTQMGFPKFSYCISGVATHIDAVAILRPGRVHSPARRNSESRGRCCPLPKSILEPDHTGAGQTMVDSGTQFTFLLGPVYTALKNEFLQQTKPLLRVLNDPDFVFQGAMDLCFQVPKNRPSLPNLPAVTLMFRGAEMSVSGERLLYRVPGMVRGNDQVYCFTFGNSDLLGIEAFVIGHYHQQNVWMEFDLAKSRVGVAQVRCDLASQKLGLSP
ncbi:hypothetical protein M0R45_018724 [Rubus argutus]|uniref:Peptidase A1 domain-containing protein n=1 Tax=Rubus argutus TaxID=59490 RepID=A0AAW1X595_RUBAR